MPGAKATLENCALLLIDVINDFDFPEGGRLLKYALPAAKRIARLKERAARAGVPVIYVNDNFGRWKSDFRQQIRHCLKPASIGRPVSELLQPGKEDYFVLKPKHSGFFSSSLDVLLDSLSIKNLVLTGFSSEICVLYTANDAYMRGFGIWVASDCVAAEKPTSTRVALDQMRRCLKAETMPSAHLRF